MRARIKEKKSKKTTKDKENTMSNFKKIKEKIRLLLNQSKYNPFITQKNQITKKLRLMKQKHKIKILNGRDCQKFLKNIDYF